MPKWTLTQPPVWKTDAIATPAGWEDPVTGELLVTINGLSTFKEPGGLAALLKVSLDKTSYNSGQVVTAKVHYNQNVVVTGTPHLTISFNGNSRVFAYATGTGTPTLNFTYTSVSGDASTAGEVLAVSPVALNSGTIKSADNAANAPLAFSGTQIDSKIATTIVNVGPTISSVAGISGAYVTSGHILPTVTFNKAVTVTGVPTFPLTINGVSKNAAYASGSGTNVLHFSYLVVSGDVAMAGQLATGTTLSLPGGATLKDSLAANATLTFTAPDTSTVTVN